MNQIFTEFMEAVVKIQGSFLLATALCIRGIWSGIDVMSG
jgi:hypothetical protein